MTKPRVQLDAFVIGLFMIFAAFLVFEYPRLYLEGNAVRNCFDIIGFLAIILGVLLRMSARGYKKFASQQGCALVTEGPYQCVRNPMYLGTFLVAVGFMCSLYPAVFIMVFMVIFYLRFIVEIRKEEQWLLNTFRDQYEDYCRNVPRFIPTWQSIHRACIRQIFFSRHMWTTKERIGLIFWPILNIGVELVQEKILWGRVDYLPMIVNIAIVAFLFGWSLIYIFREGSTST